MAITGSEMGGNQSPRCRSAFKPFCKQLFLGEKRQGNPRRDTTAMFSLRLRYSTNHAAAARQRQRRAWQRSWLVERRAHLAAPCLSCTP
jgi:hypothetical protein